MITNLGQTEADLQLFYLNILTWVWSKFYKVSDYAVCSLYRSGEMRQMPSMAKPASILTIMLEILEHVFNSVIHSHVLQNPGWFNFKN